MPNISEDVVALVLLGATLYAWLDIALAIGRAFQ